MINQVFQYIDSNFSSFVKETKSFCSHRSVKGDVKGLAGASEFVHAKLLSLGFHVQEKRVEGRPPVFYAFREGRSSITVLAYNHYDVVPEGNLNAWTLDPFSIAEANGRLWGRGISDDKGALMSRLQAVEAILKTDGELPCNTAFLFEGEEETGSDTIAEMASAKDEFLREAAHADLCLWENGRMLPDGSPEAAFGVRTTLMATLSVKTMNCEEHGRMGAELPNAAWRLIWALSTLKNAQDEILIDGFYDDVLSPTEEDLRVIDSYPYDEAETLRRKEIPAFVNDLKGLDLKKRIFLEPSLNVTGFQAGEPWKGARNIIPNAASAVISIILVPNQTVQDTLEKIRKHLDNKGFEDVEVTGNQEGYPVRTEMSSHWSTVLVNAAARVYEKPLKLSITQLGSGPAYLLREVSPDLAIIAACGVASLQSGHHSPRENISLADYKNGIKYMASLLYEAETQDMKA